MFAGLFLLAITLVHSLVFVARLTWRFTLDLCAHLLRDRPWVVEARLNGQREDILLWRVRGWRESRAAVAEVARSLARGDRMTRHGEGELQPVVPHR